jgi:hypothetical protein
VQSSGRSAPARLGELGKLGHDIIGGDVDGGRAFQQKTRLHKG